jgi:hypothetical protein
MKKTKLNRLPGETRSEAESRVYLERRTAVVNFIIKFSQENGYAPSIRDLMPAIGVFSTSTAYKVLFRMEEQELILVSQGVARSMKVLPLGMELVS